MAGYMFGCPHCSAKLEARDETRAGRVISCPQCNQQLTIPAPPPMGVLLSSPAKSAAPPPEPSPPQIHVNADPGFKRGMSPAKAYDGGESAPVASSSGYEKLSPANELDSTPQHTIEAGEDLEAYSFTVPEAGEPTPPPRKKKKKFVEPEPEVEDVHPLEDPKYQLLILIAVVALIVGGWKWYKSGDIKKNEQLEKEIAAAKAANEAPPPPAAPGMLPGASAPIEPAPAAATGALPGAAASPPVEPGQLPGAAPNALPGAAETPGTNSPQPIPESSTPNVLKPQGSTAPGTLPGAAPEEKPREPDSNE